MLKSFAKRSMDIGLALAALPIAVPVVGVSALAVILESPGGPFFIQWRVGKGSRKFRCYKLRTMVENAENLGAGLYADKDDERFTRFGLFARRFSLDELPQLINVLRGEMSIVGPRPMVPGIVDQYRSDYEVILKVKPGLTGLSQVSGRNELPRSKRLELDKQYAEGWGVAGDIKIIAKTVFVVLGGDGQRNDQSRSEVER